MSVINTTLASSLPSGGIGEISTYFKVTNHLQLVLPISVFLLGYFIGPILCGPLSEHFGRKPVMIVSFSLYTVFTLGCALAPTWSALLVFRWLCGVMASAPIAVVGGVYADIFGEPRKRGIAMAVFMGATTFGPALGPLASGFIATVSWRWCFWLGLMLAGATLPFLFIIPETYVPVLIAKKAAKIRKETGNSSIMASSELQTKSVRHILTVVMTRPFRMILHESIVLFTCMYLSLAYGIFYLYFEAYPIIFQGPNSIYHFTPGIAGLAFLPIGIGASVCTFIFIWYDSFLVKAQKRNAPWAAVEEYRRLPLACVGGPLYVIGLLWLAWSAKPDVHWIVPILSGVPFGMGFLLIFMAMLNYLTDAYKTFAASAQGIASTTRAIAGALLPFAAKPMFAKLGVDWACSLLAFLSLGMALIPWMFIRFGDRIRANSRFCQHLKKLDEEEAEREVKRQLSERLPSSEKVDEKV
jgi:multidrug resistance protein